MKSHWKHHGLAITLFVLFALCLVGHAISGWHVYNDDQREHHGHAIHFTSYLATNAFAETVFENWESEFLQAATYIFLTAKLYQRGSSESKDPEQAAEVDADPAEARTDPKAPWPVRRGGVWLALYKNSLVIVFATLFLLSLLLHAAGGAASYSAQQLQHGGQPVTLAQYLGTSQFWFESLQNWQSEFLALFTMVAFSIVLRQEGSPESKPVASPHSATGSA